MHVYSRGPGKSKKNATNNNNNNTRRVDRKKAAKLNENELSHQTIFYTLGHIELK